MLDHVPEATGKTQAHSYGAECSNFNGSVLEMRAVMLTGVTEDDIFRNAIARHFAKFKPSSNVHCEADIYVSVQERILFVKNDVLELLNHKGHKLVIIRILRCDFLDAFSGPRPYSGCSGSRLSIMGLRPMAACWADPVRDKEL
jgi:hypothetical protein